MKRHLTYANVMSTVAVFLALAGGAVWAADKFGARDIKKNAVRSKHIKAEAVKSSELAVGIPPGRHGGARELGHKLLQ